MAVTQRPAMSSEAAPTMLPPEALRLFQGKLMRKIVTAHGTTFSCRFAVLTARHLLLAPQHEPSKTSGTLDRSGGSFARYGESVEVGATTEDIQAAFEVYVGDGAAVEAPKRDSLRQAIKHLSLYTTEENFEVACQIIDTDKSPGMSREEFQSLVKYSSYCNGVLDFIPLEEIAGSDFHVFEKKTTSALTKADHDARSGEQNGSGVRALGESLKQIFEKGTGVDVDGKW